MGAHSVTQTMTPILTAKGFLCIVHLMRQNTADTNEKTNMFENHIHQEQKCEVLILTDLTLSCLEGFVTRVGRVDRKVTCTL